MKPANDFLNGSFILMETAGEDGRTLRGKQALVLDGFQVSYGV